MSMAKIFEVFGIIQYLMLSVGKILKYVWPEIKKYKWSFFGVFILFGLGVVIASIINPLIYKEIIDLIAGTPIQEINASSLFFLIFLYFGGLFAYNVFFRAGDYLDGYFQVNVMRNLNNLAFDKLLKHSYKFFSNNFSGALVAKVKRFSGSFETAHDIVAINIWLAIVHLAGVFIILFYKIPVLGWILMAWTLIYGFLTFFFIKYKIKYDLLEAEADSQVTASLADTITNILNLKIFSAAFKEIKSFANVTKSASEKGLRAWNFANFQNTIQGFLTFVLQATILYVAIKFLLAGKISLGMVVLVETYAVGIFERLWNLGRSSAKLFKAFSNMQEMIDVFEQKIDILDPEKPEIPKIKGGHINFNNVTFAYTKDNKDVFANFNLDIKPGERVGLVGHSGSGKTTITKLLLRFVDVQKGQILIDGQNIAKIRQDDLRSSISYVPQEPILFHRTIRENIAYSRPEATDDEIIEAAKKAHAHEFIVNLPNGYDTLVGERGIKLSGGERQRVAIARVMLKNAPILVLDEATSSLDSISENYIQEALGELMKGKTTIVIAHRLSTIQKMDRIVVLENGKIAEDGSHKNLLAKKGVYYDLWTHQAGGFIE